MTRFAVSQYIALHAIRFIQMQLQQQHKLLHSRHSQVLIQLTLTHLHAYTNTLIQLCMDMCIYVGSRETYRNLVTATNGLFNRESNCDEMMNEQEFWKKEKLFTHTHTHTTNQPTTHISQKMAFRVYERKNEMYERLNRKKR